MKKYLIEIETGGWVNDYPIPPVFQLEYRAHFIEVSESGEVKLSDQSVSSLTREREGVEKIKRTLELWAEMPLASEAPTAIIAQTANCRWCKRPVTPDPTTREQLAEGIQCSESLLHGRPNRPMQEWADAHRCHLDAASVP